MKRTKKKITNPANEKKKKRKREREKYSGIKQRDFINRLVLSEGFRVQISTMLTANDKTMNDEQRIMALDFLYKLHIFATQP